MDLSGPTSFPNDILSVVLPAFDGAFRVRHPLSCHRRDPEQALRSLLWPARSVWRGASGSSGCRTCTRVWTRSARNTANIRCSWARVSSPTRRGSTTARVGSCRSGSAALPARRPANGWGSRCLWVRCSSVDSLEGSSHGRCACDPSFHRCRGIRLITTHRAERIHTSQDIWAHPLETGGEPGLSLETSPLEFLTACSVPTHCAGSSKPS